MVCLCVVELDRTDLLIYEEVARMPPFQRKTLVLLGAKNVGRRTLKQRLIKADPARFTSVVPCTSVYIASLLPISRHASRLMLPKTFKTPHFPYPVVYLGIEFGITG